MRPPRAAPSRSRWCLTRRLSMWAWNSVLMVALLALAIDFDLLALGRIGLLRDALDMPFDRLCCALL
eukprot:3560808-Pyramimonas_sp.AAC.1